MKSPHETEADGAFFTRLGLAFAISIIVSGVMMVAVGPVPQEEGPQIAALDVTGPVIAGR